MNEIKRATFGDWRTPVHVYDQVYVHVHVHVRMYMYFMCMHKWTCACACMCIVCAYACMHVCVCVCTVEGSVGSDAVGSCKSHSQVTQCSQVKSCESARVSAETVSGGSSRLSASLLIS